LHRPLQTRLIGIIRGAMAVQSRPSAAHDLSASRAR